MNPRGDILHGDVLIEGNRIAKVGGVFTEADEVIDASGLTLLPGLVQSHVHLCQTLFRNVADDLELLDWLRQRIWPLEAAHDEESLRWSARLGLAELIQGGTTCILDMATVRHTHIVFEEAARAGIRATIGKAMMDASPDSAPRALREETRASLDESVALCRTWHRAEEERLRYAFSPRFVLSCTEELLKEVARLASEHDTLIHSHASENRREVELVRQKTGQGNVQYLHRLGLTGSRVCLAHCIWLDDAEMNLLKDTDTKVLHCPSANLKLGSGIARVPEMLERGIGVSIGADGAPCNNNLDIFLEMRLASLIQKPRRGPTAMPAEVVLRMATVEGARALGLADQIGSIEPGKKADLILLDLHRLHNSPGNSIYSQIVYSAKATDVQTVVIDGRVVMRDRALQTLDEEEITAKCAETQRRLLNSV